MSEQRQPDYISLICYAGLLVCGIYLLTMAFVGDEFEQLTERTEQHEDPAVPVVVEGPIIPQKPLPIIVESFDLQAKGSKVQTRHPEMKVLYKEGTHLLLVLDMKNRQEVEFELLFHDDPKGWCANIGNSPSNNGWRGDAGNFSHDSELQVKEKQLAAFGNDYTANEVALDDNARLIEANDFVSPAGHARIKVRNGTLMWESTTGASGQKNSEFLFRWDSEYDAERGGPNDTLLYAAFNRVIASNARNGECAKGVTITLR